MLLCVSTNGCRVWEGGAAVGPKCNVFALELLVGLWLVDGGAVGVVFCVCLNWFFWGRLVRGQPGNIRTVVLFRTVVLLKLSEIMISYCRFQSDTAPARFMTPSLAPPPNCHLFSLYHQLSLESPSLRVNCVIHDSIHLLLHLVLVLLRLLRKSLSPTPLTTNTSPLTFCFNP